MAFDGVFAFQGKDHITASQLGRIVEGVAGKGRYVLPTLNQMTAEMQTANKVRVGTGDLVMDGRVVTNEAAVDLTVESGTSGYKRNDLVVCRYTKNASTGVETFAAEVVKGTPTTGTAADPEVTEGDISTGSANAVMPLWRIPLNGITPGAPVRIAPVASTLKTLGDSVSPIEKTLKTLGDSVSLIEKTLKTLRDSVSPIEKQVFTGLTVEGAARGGSVTVHIVGNNAMTTTKGVKVGSVKAAYRPKVPARAIFGVQGTSWGIVSVDVDGVVKLIHRYGNDSLTWGTVDISVSYTI